MKTVEEIVTMMEDQILSRKKKVLLLESYCIRRERRAVENFYEKIKAAIADDMSLLKKEVMKNAGNE